MSQNPTAPAVTDAATLALLALGAALSAALGATLATLHARREHAAALDAARASLRREVRRNAELVRATTHAHRREQIAAAQVVQLTYALHDATAQAQGAHAVLGGDVRRRFSVN